MSDNYCPTCKTEVTPVKMDFGIGHYEYWGCGGFHRDVRIVCPECETEVENPVEEDWE
jgi:uncharacterized Zn finger protein (UPF0148 family)